MNVQISRRDALLGSGALVVSFSLAGTPEQAMAQAAKPVSLTEVDFVFGYRQKRQGDHLFRQSRSRHQRLYGIAADRYDELDVPLIVSTDPRRYAAHARPTVAARATLKNKLVRPLPRGGS